MKTIFLIQIIFLVTLTISCGNDTNNKAIGENIEVLDNSDCGFTGNIAGELAYGVNHDLTNGCGGAATRDSELITSFGGTTGNEPNIKLYHENFIPGDIGANKTAHIVIHKVIGDNREWSTNLGACSITIMSNQVSDSGKVKISGSGTCASPALPDSNTGATANITIEPFTFTSMWLNWH